MCSRSRDMCAMRGLLCLTVLNVTSASLLTTKRTQSSRDGLADEQFFDRYFGQHDPASTYGPDLQRNLAVTLPAQMGVHFPQAEGSIDHTAEGAKLGEWQRKNLLALSNLTSYSGLLDGATVFYVPDLGPHVKQFEVDAVPILGRTYTHYGTRMLSVIVYTPGSGHILELQSDRCTECSRWAAFGPLECAVAHRLPRRASFYRQAWLNATLAADGWRTVGPAQLPAPIVVQLKQLARQLESTVSFWKEITNVEVRTEGKCTTATAMTGIGPFADNATGDTSIEDYPLQYVFVHNRMQQRSVRGYLDFLDRLNSERVGFGWGWDRALDFHVKLIDSRHFNRETVLGVELDHWASVLTAHGIRFAPFNLTQTRSCTDWNVDEQSGVGRQIDFGRRQQLNSIPRSSPGVRFGGSSMIYTTGPANLGIEFWGKMGTSYFSADKPVFSWGGEYGSPTSDCRQYLSPADCSASVSNHSRSVLRARVAANPPSNSAFAQLSCPASGYISGINQATFGSNPGDCQTGFSELSECQVDIKGLVQTLCIGRRSCRVPASTTIFGIACNSSNGWVTAVEATCMSGTRSSTTDTATPINV